MKSSLIKYGIPSVACLLAIVVFSCWWWTGGLDKVKAADSSGRAKAQALVAAYAKHAGAQDALHSTLDSDNDRSFGDFGFHYFPERDVLQARVYIVLSDTKDQPDRATYPRRVAAGLNDPKFGGMYDRDGGYFFLDESKQITFLAKDYPVESATPSGFIRDVDSLNALAGTWVMSWFGHAANQILGHEPPPTRRITLEDNPYKR